MVIAGSVRTGVYYDSVTLMSVAKKLSGMDGVVDAAVVMGTEENRAILADAGLLTPEFASARDADLLIAVIAHALGLFAQSILIDGNGLDIGQDLAGLLIHVAQVITRH